MLLVVDANAASARTYHTEYGRIYNRPAPTRDRIMPSLYGLQYYRQTGSYPQGFRAYNTPPLLSPETQEFSRFAYDDVPPVERPLPWQRIKKSVSIG